MNQPPVTDAPASLPVVVDTNVVSYLSKGDTRAANYRPHLTGRVLILSFMSLAELDHWMEIGRWGPDRREALRAFLGNYAVHYPDRRLCQFWAAAMSAARWAGKPINPADAWIAAAALFLNAPLVTHNPADYAGVPGLTILSETS